MVQSEKGISRYPRDLAVKALVQVLSEHEPLDEFLANLAEKHHQLPHAWLQEVCSGTLRWKGRLDSILDSVSMKKKPSGWLRKVLLIATYQLVVQDRTSPGAVVSETVDEVKRKEGNAPAAFANACLRKIARHASELRNPPRPLLEIQEGSHLSETEQKSLASWASLPVWFWNKIYYQHGLEWASQFALACLERPTQWIRTKDPHAQPGEWAKSGPVLGSWQVSEGGPITEREGFAEGNFIVQDISSQFLVAQVASIVSKALSETGSRPHFGAEVEELQAGEASKVQSNFRSVRPNGLTALDLCAAPGGKAVHLAWSGFEVTATDRTESRVPLLKDTLRRVAPEVELLAWKDLAQCASKHLVWVDAPCSGTGIIRRHPDVRWLKQEKDLVGLGQAQREALLLGWEKVLPGGFLVYSVCSVLKEEGPQVIQLAGLGDCLIGQWLLCPQVAPFGDGFWAGLLRKPE